MRADRRRSTTHSVVRQTLVFGYLCILVNAQGARVTVPRAVSLEKESMTSRDLEFRNGLHDS